MAAKASPQSTLRKVTDEILSQQQTLREGGGEAGRARQKKFGRMTARDRIDYLLDDAASFLELNLWAAYGMYSEWGAVPAAGVVTGIGKVEKRQCMIIANDATVKAGAFFPQTAKKVLRAQRVAAACGLPILYLVDSAGVFLPMQDEVFPDEDDFGRIFRNNAVLSALGIPQMAAIMGNCVAGGAYLPVLCDKILMTEGSAMYLAGPALVKAAIGQSVDEETLGGAKMHAEISGTVDFREADDEACLTRLRSLVGKLPADAASPRKKTKTQRDPAALYEIMGGQYDVREILSCIVDAGSMDEYKADFGKTVVCTYATLGGRAIGVVGNTHVPVHSKDRGLQLGGVIYGDSAEKAARFVMDCEQSRLPIVFLQDVQGFMVGRDAEQSGIIRSGAKLVNAVSNVTVPKITVITGGSFGAGNYALCSKAFDPVMVFAWPGAKYAVMGGAQAAGTLLALEERKKKGAGKLLCEEDREKLREEITERYESQTDIRYGAARGWVDAIIAPDATRDVLIHALEVATRAKTAPGFRSGVFQV